MAVYNKTAIFASAIVLWCNGSTTGFGSVCGGSNPPRTTKRDVTRKRVCVPFPYGLLASIPKRKNCGGSNPPRTWRKGAQLGNTGRVPFPYGLLASIPKRKNCGGSNPPRTWRKGAQLGNTGRVPFPYGLLASIPKRKNCGGSNPPRTWRKGAQLGNTGRVPFPYLASIPKRKSNVAPVGAHNSMDRADCHGALHF